MTHDHHTIPTAPKTTIECAKFVRDQLLQALDNWPDVAELNNSFAQISLEHTRLSLWIQAHEPNHHD